MVERRKRILFVVEAMGGGVFTYIVDLANELVKEFDMYIAYGIRKQTPKDYKQYFDNRINLIQVENFERSINPARDLRAFYEVKNIANKIKPDIIHLHSSKAGVIGRVAFNGYKVDRKEVPLFYTPHGYSFLMKNHSALKRTAYRLIESACGKLNCTTISCSAGEHQESLKLNKRAVYINNGINVEKLVQTLGKIKIGNHPFTVFTLGRICYQKNPVMFNQIAEAMPDVRFLWIGDGELREELKSKNIEITGWADRKTALTKAMSADVFLLTSLWEGLPVSLLEAMYMKKPCVVSDVIGNHDVIENGRNGFICGDVRKFIEAIRSIQREMSGQSFEDEFGSTSIYLKAIVRGKTEKLIERAFEDIMKKYNTKVMAMVYNEIYTGIGRGGGAILLVWSSFQCRHPAPKSKLVCAHCI